MLKQLYISNLFGNKIINISFNEDITLLVGKNGCGKTTILNIISAISSGNLEQLFNYDFSDIRITYYYDNQERRVDVLKKTKQTLLITWKDKLITYNKNDKSLSANFRNYLKDIKREINMMYIPLSREIHDNDIEQMYNDEVNVISNITYKNFISNSVNNISVIDSSLEYVNKLVKENHRKTFLTFEELNKNMAREMFQSSFDYYPEYTDFSKIMDDLNEKNSINELKQAFREMGFLTLDFEERINEFIEKLRIGSIAYREWRKDTNKFTKEAGTFIANISQVDRIKKWQNIVQKSSNQKAQNQESMNNFLTIVNSFLKESHKEIVFDDTEGKLIFITKNNANNSLDKMSSGEKQIVIFFAYLIFDANHNKNAVFIIDEPEISLHVSWQRRFVESIIQAAPNLQFVFATHSPEIIGVYRNTSCAVIGSDAD